MGSRRATAGVFDWSGADRLVAFAQQHGQLVRGHTLLWHNQLPDWLTTGVANGTISNSAAHGTCWSSTSSPRWAATGARSGSGTSPTSSLPTPIPPAINPNDFWVSNLGPGIIPQAFRWAQEADPHALLFYNDYNIAGEDGTNAKSDAAYTWLGQMQDQGVPIDGVGDQGHLDTQFGFSHPDDAGLSAVRQPGPEDSHHRSRRPHVRRRPGHAGTHRSSRDVRAAV